MHPQPLCPKCSKSYPPGEAICPFCGVVFAKLRLPGERPVRQAATASVDPLDAVYASASRGPSLIKFLVIGAVVVGVGYAPKYFKARKLDQKLEAIQKRAGALQAGAEVDLWSLKEDQNLHVMAERLRMRGITAKLHEFQSARELTESAVMERLRKDQPNLDGQVGVPLLQLSSGDVIVPSEFDGLLKPIPVMDRYGGRTPPYIVVYGTGCPHTKMAMIALKGGNIPFEYVDWNANIQNGGKAVAHMIESGDPARQIKSPVIEVNGYARGRPELAEVLERYRQ